jgi:hypothetical protein
MEKRMSEQSVDWIESEVEPEGIWVRRLRPLLDIPNEERRVIRMGSGGSARNTTSKLRAGEYPLPPGRFEFRADGRDVLATYLGDG